MKRWNGRKEEKVYKPVLRLLLLLSGTCVGLWFLFPLLTHGILNIGNGTGLILAFLVISYALFMPALHRFLRKCWKKRIGKVALSIVGAVFLAVLATAFVATVCMAAAAGREPEGGETVVVLGCAVYGERPSLMLKERMDAAYEYLAEHEDSVCILSGGKGPGEDISEAECMYRYLLKKGIAGERLFKEERSTSTRENINFSKSIIEENGLEKKIAIATNEFHEYRAGRIAKSQGIEAAAVPGKTAWWLFPTYYVRELYGIVYEFIF